MSIARGSLRPHKVDLGFGFRKTGKALSPTGGFLRPKTKRSAQLRPTKLEGEFHVRFLGLHVLHCPNSLASQTARTPSAPLVARSRERRQAGAGVASLEVRSPAAELRLELGLEAPIDPGICGWRGGEGGWKWEKQKGRPKRRKTACVWCGGGMREGGVGEGGKGGGWLGGGSSHAGLTFEGNYILCCCFNRRPRRSRSNFGASPKAKRDGPPMVPVWMEKSISHRSGPICLGVSFLMGAPKIVFCKGKTDHLGWDFKGKSTGKPKRATMLGGASPSPNKPGKRKTTKNQLGQKRPPDLWFTIRTRRSHGFGKASKPGATTPEQSKSERERRKWLITRVVVDHSGLIETQPFLIPNGFRNHPQ